MTARPHLAADPASLPRPSARVAHVAEVLDCDPSDVRRLISAGEIEIHRKGVRGIRVFLDSVRAYQERQSEPLPSRAPAVIHKAKAPATASSAAYRATMARAKALGIV